MEDDASDSKIFLEGGQESTKQLRRLHALLNSSLLIRPFRALRTALCFSIGALIALHTAALATLIALALQQRAFLEHLRSAGAQSRLLVEAVAFARALNAEVYGPAYLDGLDIRGGLESIADEIKANNTDLFDAASNVGGSRGKALGQLWTSADLAISMRPGSGEPEVMMTSFSDVMVMYVSAACE